MSVYKTKKNEKNLPLKELCADVSPLDYGGTFYRQNDDGSYETYEIQPVREHLSLAAMGDVAFPWWTKEAYIDSDTIREAREGKHDSALSSCDVDPTTAEELEIVYALHETFSEEGPCGWRTDLGILRCIATYNEWRAAEAEFRSDVRDFAS